MGIHNSISESETQKIQCLIEQEQLATYIDCAESNARALSLANSGRSEVQRSWFHSMLAAYPLDQSTGLQFMRLAEAYLRTPDARSQMDLIEDRFGEIAPERPVQGINHWLVHIAFLGLWTFHLVYRLRAYSLVRHTFQSVIRKICRFGLKVMGREFVMAQTIDEAVKNSQKISGDLPRYSFDMLGEGAVTEGDAERYFHQYLQALNALASQGDSIAKKDGISVKLSALHPSYDIWHWESSAPILLQRMKTLCLVAKEKQIGLNIDAEEYARLHLGLEIVKALRTDPDLNDWNGLGIVIQAYHCRAYDVLLELIEFLDRHQQKLMVRLVKGAYWDTEIKHAQELGLGEFPVYTRKAHTDISYLACARRMLARVDIIYPQFATHNAKSIADIWEMATRFRRSADQFEFQRLFGMGAALHDAIQSDGAQSRVYAPVGSHQDLLAYLVRRLLENAANTSFISQLANPKLAMTDLVKSPLEVIKDNPVVSRPQTGAELFLPRMNSQGFAIDEPTVIMRLHQDSRAYQFSFTGHDVPVFEPATGHLIGHYNLDTYDSINKKWALGQAAASRWGEESDRSSYLLEVARLFEANHLGLINLLQREAGKTLTDAIGEIREAVDFLRYYAARPEASTLVNGRMAVCISPWNFPLAIFTGQIAAAVVSGNAVIAKPAEQTSLIAQAALAFWNTVLPKGVVQLVLGDGAHVGPVLLNHSKISTLAFTGSTETARRIQKILAYSDNYATRLIAETGGLNVCIADSTALPERLVRDVVVSAFHSAGQRCSACRVLLVQSEIYLEVREMLIGAMQTLVVGNPQSLDTDVGPVIDQTAKTELLEYIESCRSNVLYQTSVPTEGCYVPPTLIEIDSLDRVDREQFGPILHIMAYKRDDLESHINSLMAKGYGLTAAVQSRNETFIKAVKEKLRVGNLYVNRNQVGAVVGSQPFGGEGLSGTGPKAGGPRYLSAFQPVEQNIHIEPLSWRSQQNLDMKDRIASALRNQMHEMSTELVRQEDCTGPTGELNQLSEYPRGVWLALGDAAGPLVQEAIEMGNRVVWLSDLDREKSINPRLSHINIDGFAYDWLVDLPFNGLLVSTTEECLKEIAQKLAEREGPLLPIVTQTGYSSQLVLERHISVDTTASGGNPGLLMSAVQ